MPKRRNLNGLPHNLTKSYFGTLRYYESGYMADWLLSTARGFSVNFVTLDILNIKIDPVEMEIFPLMYHLKDLKNIIDKELVQNGFETNFIAEAQIKIEIPNSNAYSNSFYCYPELVDIEGRHYKAKRKIIESAYENKFYHFEHQTMLSSLFLKLKRLFKSG